MTCQGARLNKRKIHLSAAIYKLARSIVYLLPILKRQSTTTKGGGRE